MLAAADESDIMSVSQSQPVEWMIHPKLLGVSCAFASVLRAVTCLCCCVWSMLCVWRVWCVWPCCVCGVRAVRAERAELLCAC